MDKLRINKLREEWLKEEEIAHIVGWNFSHINDRYSEEGDLPWDYYLLIKKYLRDDMLLLDYDTGGGEFLLSLNHPFDKTYATEGYDPNVKLCENKLIPLGIHFKKCSDESNIPFDDGTFDIIINRHGSFNPKELYRLLKPSGIFITQQVGDENDRDLVEMVLPNTPKAFNGLDLDNQLKEFKKAGFKIIESGEAFRPIEFYDMGAFVWFTHIIEWEFPNFSVDNCFDKLLQMQDILDKNGKIVGTTHRYMIVAVK